MFRWRRRKIRPYGLKLFTGYGGETYSNRFKIEYLEPVIDKGSERARIRTEIKKQIDNGNTRTKNQNKLY